MAKTIAEYSNLMTEWHHIKNDKLPQDVSAGSRYKAWFVCKEGHEWQAAVYSRTGKDKCGCPWCSGKSGLITKERSLLFNFPVIAAEWHPTKNGLTPENVAKTSGKKAWWICPNGHEYEAVIATRTKQGCGCPWCSGKSGLVLYERSLEFLYPEITKEWHEKNIKKPREVAAKSHAKVWWTCPKGHEYEAAVSNRTNRQSGCPLCAPDKVSQHYLNISSLADDLVLSKEFHPTKNGNLKSSDLVRSSDSIVWWLCENGHEWQNKVSHRRGRKCPYCLNQRVCQDNCLAVTHPELAKEWHPTKNGTLTPRDIITGNNSKFWWRCDKGHEWEASGNNRKRAGCPYCSRKLACEDNCLATTHPELAKEWHPTKNGTLTPFNTVSGRHKKVWWKCNVANDHEWLSPPNWRTRGEGCPCCSGKKVVLSNCLATTDPELAKEWHSKNGKLTPYDVTVGSDKNVWWKCDVADDHEWQATISSRSKSGCPCCCNKKLVKSNCLAILKPELAQEWHPLKNNKTPFDVVAGSSRKAWWKCKQGHDFCSQINDRIKGRGCPKCAESTGEKRVRLHLEHLGIKFQSQYKFKTSEISWARFDFATSKCLIEYHGQQHYIPCSFGSKGRHADIKCLISAMRRDQKKEQWCKKHNIPLFVVPYWEYGRIPELIDGFLSQKCVKQTDPPELVVKYKLMREKILEMLCSKNFVLP